TSAAGGAMRTRNARIVLIGFLSAAVLMPTYGRAQASQPAAPQYADWLFNGEPMLFSGLAFYPTRGTRFFDAQIMTQVGVYRSVPVSADVTQQQLSVVYAPIGRGLMRVYEVNPRSIVTLPVPPPEPAPDADAAVPRLVSNPAPADIPRPTRMESVRRPDARN